MIDVAILRNSPEELASSLAKRGMDLDVGALGELDARRRQARSSAEEIRSRQKDAGQQIKQLQGAGRDAAIAAAGSLADEYKAALAAADELDEQFHKQWVNLPNMVDSTAAEGLAEEDAEEISTWGTAPEFAFEPKDHVELGVLHDIIDIERAVKVSGSRFAFMKGELVLLEFALVRWALDRLGEEGFRAVSPPVLVRDEALYGTGFFPADREQVYALEADEMYLVGTSEVPLAAMHLDEILPADELPYKYVGFSTCFRREAGTYGKDTRGMFRVHQFDKVEMFVFCRPEDGAAMHDHLLKQEESLVQELEIPYRVVNVAAGDLGSSAAKKFDIEAWFPGQGAYREITSTSNTTDYQSRRLKIRYKSDTGNQLVHTLNGTAVAIGRTIIALMENHQQADGSIRIPEALVPYTGFDRIG